MTTTMEPPIRRTHRGHPQGFPHSRPDTLAWCHGDAPGGDEVHIADAAELVAKLRERLTWARKRSAAMRGANAAGQFTVSTRAGMDRAPDVRAQAVLVWLTQPMPLLRNKDTRDMLLAAMDSTFTSGVYLALELTRADRAELGTTRWGTALAERLRLHHGGTTAFYGNW